VLFVLMNSKRFRSATGASNDSIWLCLLTDGGLAALRQHIATQLAAAVGSIEVAVPAELMQLQQCGVLCCLVFPVNNRQTI